MSGTLTRVTMASVGSADRRNRSEDRCVHDWYDQHEETITPFHNAYLLLVLTPYVMDYRNVAVITMHCSS
ncbi:hypothetical protein KCU81_g489, partial [Aureobasidium melanogenum]